VSLPDNDSIPEWMNEESDEIAERAEALLARHEEEDHDGEICHEQRAGFIGWLAHRLGVRDAASVMLVIDVLAEYEEGHREREGGSNGHAH
jgi:hypothetical protein